MNPMEPFENAANFMDDVGRFEAAVHAPPTVLPQVEVPSILLALDGSNQDGAARYIAGQVGKVLSATVHEQAGLATAPEIRDRGDAVQAGLIVVPVPFGADIGLLQEESLGMEVDRLLLESHVPILAVRQPLTEDRLAAAMRRILVPLAPGEHHNPLALAWACKLLGQGGELQMLEIADQDVLAEARLLLDRKEISEATQQASLERVLSRQFASLVAIVQKTSSEVGFGVHVVAASGRFVAQSISAMHDAPTLTVLAGSRDRRSNSYHRAVDMILAASGPVLVV